MNYDFVSWKPGIILPLPSMVLHKPLIKHSGNLLKLWCWGPYIKSIMTESWQRPSFWEYKAIITNLNLVIFFLYQEYREKKHIKSVQYDNLWEFGVEKNWRGVNIFTRFSATHTAKSNCRRTHTCQLSLIGTKHVTLQTFQMISMKML